MLRGAVKTLGFRMRSLISLLLVLMLATAAFAADRNAVLQRVRAELATLLKKDAATLPVDKPVIQLGADDLTVVEWVMAIERTYPTIRIPDDKTTDPKSRTTRKDLTIAQMVSIVAEALDNPKSRK